MMNYEVIWFYLIAILFIGYFVLEGFDFGVGILLPFVAKNDTERRMVINTIGPHWDGNEVWLVTAGGAMFAAFPNWYASLFSGFYFAFFLLLIALIIRGVGFEFRSKVTSTTWRSFWDWAIFAGSFIPALLWGIAFTNFIRGVPIDQNFIFVGNFWDLLNFYSIVGGLVTLTGFTVHGAIFLSMKLEQPFGERMNRIARKLWFPNVIVLLFFVIETYVFTDIINQLGVNPGVVPIGAILSLISVGYLLFIKQNGWAFFMNCLTIVFSATTIFMILFPRLLVSSIDPAYSLTIMNSASGEYTLRIMSIIALIFVPIVIGYQSWSYWIFRKRIGSDAKSLHY